MPIYASHIYTYITDLVITINRLHPDVLLGLMLETSVENKRTVYVIIVASSLQAKNASKTSRESHVCHFFFFFFFFLQNKENI